MRETGGRFQSLPKGLIQGGLIRINGFMRAITQERYIAKSFFHDASDANFSLESSIGNQLAKTETRSRRFPGSIELISASIIR
tara:strand:- start:373 stop:621 length:249 start_codon:yes stop_codon:yes gene_type:complete